MIGAQSVPVSALLGQQSLLLNPLIEFQTIAMIPRRVLVRQIVARTGNVAGPVGSVAIVQRAQFNHVVHEVYEGLALLVLFAQDMRINLRIYLRVFSIETRHTQQTRIQRCIRKEKKKVFATEKKQGD